MICCFFVLDRLRRQTSTAVAHLPFSASVALRTVLYKFEYYYYYYYYYVVIASRMSQAARLRTETTQ